METPTSKHVCALSPHYASQIKQKKKKKKKKKPTELNKPVGALFLKKKSRASLNTSMMHMRKQIFITSEMMATPSKFNNAVFIQMTLPRFRNDLSTPKLMLKSAGHLGSN